MGEIPETSDANVAPTGSADDFATIAEKGTRRSADNLNMGMKLTYCLHSSPDFLGERNITVETGFRLIPVLGKSVMEKCDRVETTIKRYLGIVGTSEETDVDWVKRLDDMLMK
ncbi:hypothetical protein SARC_00857 [Sphaeroforma arctica JP610]|uniref:Uncharacterized protein n=1 Tax=Sphaeroforma arctica JP610 TaxID=667725 RepID=A0A0L0GDL1_9EUKA|nr:hypothetical protein SARC_00857 [Sphaeroforma arctica JP610]KNC87004.1 hypothetical protein SARC_00857 [Sphaeroforma arctica JP610]|eukprot:XP_014160906.1 hypothetical protein SARC_00857 [Sphaeroforma arctica JP610]